MDNTQLAHLWANKAKDNANGSNLSIRSGDLYSYNLLIGKHFSGFTLIQSAEGTSHTTGRHISHAWQATEYFGFQADDLARISRLSIPEIGAILFKEYAARIDKALTKLAKARSHIASTFDAVRKSAGEAMELFNLSEADPTDETYRWFISLRHGNNASYVLEDDEYLLAELIRRYNLDLLAKLKKEGTLASQLKQKKIDAQKLNADNWRNGTFHGVLYDLPVMLRVSGHDVQTSHGARVPLHEAISMYVAMTEGKELIGYKIGNFTCVKVDADTVKIGCHTIPLAEVKNILNKI